MSDELNALLNRSLQLEMAARDLIDLRAVNDDRVLASRVMCGLAFEHSESVKLLAASGSFSSAAGLIRMQFDVLVRSMWVLYAAPDATIATLLAELTSDTVKKADDVPSMSAMLGSMEGKAPDIAMNMLKEFKQYHWKPLSSWIHGGKHAFHRHSEGYPVHLLLQIIKASNGLLMMTTMHLVMISANPSLSGKVSVLQREYVDCLPTPVSPVA